MYMYYYAFECNSRYLFKPSSLKIIILFLMSDLNLRHFAVRSHHHFDLPPGVCYLTSGVELGHVWLCQVCVNWLWLVELYVDMFGCARSVLLDWLSWTWTCLVVPGLCYLTGWVELGHVWLCQVCVTWLVELNLDMFGCARCVLLDWLSWTWTCLVVPGLCYLPGGVELGHVWLCQVCVTCLVELNLDMFGCARSVLLDWWSWTWTCLVVPVLCYLTGGVELGHVWLCQFCVTWLVELNLDMFGCASSVLLDWWSWTWTCLVVPVLCYLTGGVELGHVWLCQVCVTWLVELNLDMFGCARSVLLDWWSWTWTCLVVPGVCYLTGWVELGHVWLCQVCVTWLVELYMDMFGCARSVLLDWLSWTWTCLVVPVLCYLTGGVELGHVWLCQVCVTWLVELNLDMFGCARSVLLDWWSWTWTCLVVPGERLFPPQSGLTFSTWICVDKFSSSVCDPHPVRLLTLVRNIQGRDDSFICLSVFFASRDRALFVSTQETQMPASGECGGVVSECAIRKMWRVTENSINVAILWSLM